MEDYEYETKILMLTKAEALYLDDVCTVLTTPDRELGIPIGLRPVQGTALLAVPSKLLERIGMIILLTASENGISEAPLEVDETDLFLLREVANTNARFLDEPVGFNLKRKIYVALLEDVFKDSLQFAKLMNDLELNSTDSRNKARSNLEPNR